MAFNKQIYSQKRQEELEAKFANQDEAEKLIKLIAAEFNSDPMSVQCFDLRVVDRVKMCAAKIRKYEGLL